MNVAERALLARRLDGDQPSQTQRHLQDLLDLIPPDPEKDSLDFSAALFGSELSAEESSERLSLRRQADKPMELQLKSRGISAKNQALAKKTEAWAEDSDPFAGGGVEETASTRRSRGGRKLKEFAGAKSANAPAPMAAAMEAAADIDMDGVVPAQLESETRSAGRFFKGRSEAAGGRRFYRKLDSTREWAENNYYQLPQEAQIADLITINSFWVDFANWDGQSAFFSPHFTRATGNFSEMMFALSLLDLPIEAGDHQTVREDGSFTLKAASDLLVFRREIKAVPTDPNPGSLLVSQNFFRHGDRYRREGNQQFDKFITAEFQQGVPYGCEIVITNPTSAPQKIEVLLQVPSKSIPLLLDRKTRNVSLRLEPYSTQKVEYHFYFPSAGNFPHYPVQITRENRHIASALPFTFNVVEELTQLDRQSWEYVSQWGSQQDVFDYLEQNNVQALNLDRVAWRASDVDFFSGLLARMEKRHAYNDTLYSYSVLHGQAQALQQYLLHQDDFLADCGSWMDTQLISIEPVERHAYQHLEYSPLVNPRAHLLGGERKILNSSFYQQYHRLLDILQYKDGLSAEDQLSLVYYLFLQDRIDEALQRLEHVDPS
ncbi:MAG: hypothetical protein AAF514_22085, partial [Verrucomicrobiota bacterium]